MAALLSILVDVDVDVKSIECSGNLCLEEVLEDQSRLVVDLLCHDTGHTLAEIKTFYSWRIGMSGEPSQMSDIIGRIHKT